MCVIHFKSKSHCGLANTTGLFYFFSLKRIKVLVVKNYRHNILMEHKIKETLLTEVKIFVHIDSFFVVFLKTWHDWSKGRERWRLLTLAIYHGKKKAILAFLLSFLRHDMLDQKKKKMKAPDTGCIPWEKESYFLLFK